MRGGVHQEIVVMADDQVNLAIELFQIIAAVKTGPMGKIAEMIDPVAGRDRRIPLGNHRRIHLIGGGEGPLADPDNVGIAEMRIRGEENARLAHGDILLPGWLNDTDMTESSTRIAAPYRQS